MTKNDLEDVLSSKEENKTVEEEEIEEEEEEVEKSDEETELTEEVKAEDTEDTEEEEIDEPTERERALLKELARVKAKNRQEKVDIKLDEISSTVEDDEAMEVTKAEARVFTSWRQEALEDLVAKNPQYKKSPKLWAKFLEEYKDRVPELVWAKRNNVPVTKSLFKERLTKIHNSILGSSTSAREAGKKELMKAQSAASVMGAGAGKSSQPAEKTKTNQRKVLPRVNNSLDSWISKK